MHAASNDGITMRWYFKGGFAVAPVGAKSATIYRDVETDTVTRPVEFGTTPVVRGRITVPVF